MRDFFERITSDHAKLEEVVRMVPGFKGYLEKMDRREADRMLREHIARVMEEQRGEFDRLKKKLVDASGLTHMEKTQSVDSKLQSFIDRVRSAGSGDIKLMEAAAINSDKVDRIYGFDMALMGYVEQFKVGLGQLGEVAASGEGVGGVLEQLDAVLTEANNAWKGRSEALVGSQESV
ncbi:MAG: hypothetical protein GYB68_13040 [Chloroflexi bacterium]|nr:hypothetical protein [Chloroflexota bacterium]